MHRHQLLPKLQCSATYDPHQIDSLFLDQLQQVVQTSAAALLLVHECALVGLGFDSNCDAEQCIDTARHPSYANLALAHSI
jgi:hypothetical protein